MSSVCEIHGRQCSSTCFIKKFQSICGRSTASQDFSERAYLLKSERYIVYWERGHPVYVVKLDTCSYGKANGLVRGVCFSYGGPQVTDCVKLIFHST
ncbi:hypothetical protein ALO84_200028 [Pseudomonas syringae pv. maculicola]|nr:hypothetical protein ALO84_200028 [Pseudomonas syringae pv. maculicola]